jgi:hypothetical protein
MAQFENVYHESRGLPPEGASIPNIGPYMHPYYQKSYFKKIVE